MMALVGIYAVLLTANNTLSTHHHIIFTRYLVVPIAVLLGLPRVAVPVCQLKPPLVFINLSQRVVR